MSIYIKQYRSWHAGASVIAACLMAASGSAQTAREVRGAAAVEPLQNEPPSKIIIDPPLAEPLSRGWVVIQYRAETLHIVPVFGPAALAGPHTILIRLVNANDQAIDQEVVRVTVPKRGH
jgi:hypothetical protein